MLCYLTRHKILTNLCNGNTWTNTLTLLYVENVANASFIRCFIVTAENLTWQVVFLFFCSWWPVEEYYLLTAQITVAVILWNLKRPVSEEIPFWNDLVRFVKNKIYKRWVILILEISWIFQCQKGYTVYKYHPSMSLRFRLRISDSLYH